MDLYQCWWSVQILMGSISHFRLKCRQQMVLLTFYSIGGAHGPIATLVKNIMCLLSLRTASRLSSWHWITKSVQENILKVGKLTHLQQNQDCWQEQLQPLWPSWIWYVFFSNPVLQVANQHSKLIRFMLDWQAYLPLQLHSKGWSLLPMDEEDQVHCWDQW